MLYGKHARDVYPVKGYVRIQNWLLQKIPKVRVASTRWKFVFLSHDSTGVRNSG